MGNFLTQDFFLYLIEICTIFLINLHFVNAI